MAQHSTTFTVRAVLEADSPQQLNRMGFWFASKMREACRNSDQGKIVLGVYDDEGNFRSAVQFGGRDGDLQAILNEAFGIVEEPEDDIEFDQRPEAS